MKIQENIPLAPFTTLKIGGPARYFAAIASEDDLLEATRFAQAKNLPIFVLGGGSNLVVADAGFEGLVLKIALDEAVEIARTGGHLHVQASAGLGWDEFVRIVCAENVCGVECLSGIPGLVGGAPIQNIGAYGQDAGTTITRVRALELRIGQFVEMPASTLGFAYRRSIFNSTQPGRYIITRVDFAFDLSAKPNLTYPDLKNHFGGRLNPTPTQVYHAVREIRARKGMLIDPANPTPDCTSAGSFFKNPIVPFSKLDRIALHLGIGVEQIQHWPVSAKSEAADPGGTVPAEGNAAQTKLPAAWLIERAGFHKGFQLGAAGISTRHTLALVNRTGTATCADLLALRDHIIAGVEKAFGITLEQEPVNLC